MQEVVLEHKKEFELVLKNYRPSDESIAVLNQFPVLFLVGPSGCGRNTLIEHLVETGKFYFVRSDTTRPRRMQGDRLEHDGEFYWHISEETFLDGLKRGDYLEAAIIHEQQVSGSNSAQYKVAASQNKIATTDIEGIFGPPVFREYSQSAKFIFLVPPSFEIWIDRLNRRGAMEKSELKRRLISAQKEINAALSREYYHFVVSREIQHSVESAVSIMNNNDSLDSEEHAKSIAIQLLSDIENFLS